MAGHLILSDEDVTSELQGLWRRVNTLQHYKVGRLGAGGLWEGWELKGCGKVGSWRVGRVDQDRQKGYQLWLAGPRWSNGGPCPLPHQAYS